MKKVLSLCSVLALALVFTFTLSKPAQAAEASAQVQINGVSMAASAVHMKSGEVYVDVKSFAQATGVSYSYDSKTNALTVNGHAIKDFDVADGLPEAHVTALADATGASSLSWNGSTATVSIVYAPKLNVFGDIVSELAGCVTQNRFAPGDPVVFRATATNPITGKTQTDAKLQVHLSTGAVLDMQLGTHPPNMPNGEQYWTVKWMVPKDAQPGTLSYYVTADAGQLHGKFEPFKVQPSMLTIIPAAPAGSTTPAAPPAGSTAPASPPATQSQPPAGN